jgi:hypothetical protein
MKTDLHVVMQQVLNHQQAPCASLYLDTHRTQPQRRDDPTRYRNLVRELRDSLSSAYSPAMIAEFIAPFEHLERNEEFWNSRTEGIIVFRSPDLFLRFHVDRPVGDLAIVAESFHVKPLLKLLQTNERYHVLTLTRDTAHLYLGDRDGIEEVDLGPDAPMTMEKALGTELTERHFTRSNSGGTERSVGHTTTSDEVALDTEKFLRVVDRTVIERATRLDGLPIILCGVTELVGEFRRITRNTHILADAIVVHPHSIDRREMTKRAWSIMEPLAKQRSLNLIELYRNAATRWNGVDDIVQVAHAAVEGRIGTLLVEEQREVPGKINAVTGDIAFDDLHQPDIDDVLDDLAVMVMRMKGTVHVLPAQAMPTATGVAAILRY